MYPSDLCGCEIDLLMVVASATISIQIVTGVEVTIGNCFPEVGEILPDAEGGGQYFPN